MPQGRKNKTVELLETLVAWSGGAQEFATKTGIRKSDQSQYKRGDKKITTARLNRAARQIFGVPPAFIPLVERQVLPDTLPADLKQKAGVYALFCSAGSLLYFGKATDLHAELIQTLTRDTPSILLEGTSMTRQTFRSVTSYYSAYEITRGDAAFRKDVEAVVLRVVRSDTLNTNGAHFTRDK